METGWTLADSVLPGASGFLDGLVHPLTVPAHGLLLVAIGLLISQAIPLRLRGEMIGVVAGAIVGSGASTILSGSELVGGILTAWTGVVSLVVVADWPRARRARAVFATIGAGLVALDSAPEGGGAGRGVLSLAGTTVAVVLVIANVAFYASLRPDRFWAHVGLRVIASWIAAAALMLVAFAMRKVS